MILDTKSIALSQDLLHKTCMDFKSFPQPISYPDALSFMEERVSGIHKESEGECVWFLEHPPLYTGGTSAKQTDLLNPQFPVYETGRGGEYTYHGPGQRVAYVMLDLKKRQKTPDIRKYVRDLEEWIILTLKEFDIKGERREGRIGIWVDTLMGEKKIAALGVRVRHWITFHGIAVNVDPDLSHFGGIVPCGISNYGVTSMREVLGHDVPMDVVDKVLKSTFSLVF
jgi:lipoyl(octanoyl) transferase